VAPLKRGLVQGPLDRGTPFRDSHVAAPLKLGCFNFTCLSSRRLSSVVQAVAESYATEVTSGTQPPIPSLGPVNPRHARRCSRRPGELNWSALSVEHPIAVFPGSNREHRLHPRYSPRLWQALHGCYVWDFHVFLEFAKFHAKPPLREASKRNVGVERRFAWVSGEWRDRSPRREPNKTLSRCSTFADTERVTCRGSDSETHPSRHRLRPFGTDR
jgi:hypothetical protein